jgi:hypothetical protein
MELIPVMRHLQEHYLVENYSLEHHLQEYHWWEHRWVEPSHFHLLHLSAILESWTCSDLDHLRGEQWYIGERLRL